MRTKDNTQPLADMVADAKELSSRVLDTYRGRGQPKIQVEMASLLLRLAVVSEARVEGLTKEVADAAAELSRWPTTDAGRLSDDDLSEICHLVAHLNGETVIEQVRAAVARSASSEPPKESQS